MSTLTNWFRLWVGRQVFKRSQAFKCISHNPGPARTFADQPEADSNQSTENEQRLRVRRARPADVPRVLRFVREHARTAWPGLAAPPASPNVMLCDYVARALAQGHSMLAEQNEARRGLGQIRGVALGVSVCPWDASLLEKWARCVSCARSRRLMVFTAHCLRAPALHDKYRVHNILQVVLIVPENHPRSEELVNLLTKNAIKRGKEIGFPLIRFDVTCDETVQILEELELKKEWQLSYDIITKNLSELDKSAETTKKSSIIEKENEKEKKKDKSDLIIPTYKHQVTVFTALTGP